MEISFKDRKLEKQVNNFKKLQQKYGKNQSIKIMQRITELDAADSLYDISRLPQARLHSLSNNLDGFFAIDVKQPYRLIIEPLDGNKTDLKTIHSIRIVSIKDYH